MFMQQSRYELKNFLKFYNSSITYENKPLTNLYFI